MKEKRDESHKLEPIYRAIAEKVKMLHVMGNKLFDKDKRLKKFEQELIRRSKEVEGLKHSLTKSGVQLNDMAMLANPHTIMETPKHDGSVTESIVI